MKQYTLSTNADYRIDLLDALRGIAVFGILVINLPFMALPGQWVDNPSLRNESGIDFQLWHIVFWMFYGSQRAMFSLLFGASVLLFIKNKQRSLEIIEVSDLYYRRQLWLVFFGLINVYVLLWNGDIIFDYGCYGMVLFVFRDQSSKRLLMFAGICALLMIARDNRVLFKEKALVQKGEAVGRIDTLHTKLTIEQAEDLKAYQEMVASASRESQMEEVAKDIRKMKGSFGTVYQHRTDNYVSGFVHYTVYGIWDVLLFMFAGMALLKMGWLTGNAPSRVYWIMALVGLGVGLTLNGYRLNVMQQAGFNSVSFIRDTPIAMYEIGRIFRSLGWLGLLMLMYKSGIFNWLFWLMKPVGQMAFTNYLSQSLLGAVIFYGYGFGLYGSMQRHEVFLVIMAIVMFQTIASHLWLRYFTMGPLEWVWRQLTYWERIPIRRS